jgi:hypothetical protein
VGCQRAAVHSEGEAHLGGVAVAAENTHAARVGHCRCKAISLYKECCCKPALTRKLRASGDVHLHHVHLVSQRAHERRRRRTPANKMGCLILNMSVSGVRMTAMVGEEGGEEGTDDGWRE